jgi:Flp pilus assembly protein TadD/mono/diheme cytochrome c family protein
VRVVQRNAPAVCARLAGLLALVAASAWPAGAHAAEPTFNGDIAPLLWSRCAGCHRPDGSAPFSLIDYEDVVPRVRQIVAATRTGAMPPWLPEGRFGEFANDRRLRPEEVDLIERWVKEGVRRGPPSELPPRPQSGDGWQLGTPDVIVSLPTPYTLAPGGADVFRTFVMSVPLPATRYVRGVEIRPGNPRAVHHASVGIDRTPASRQLDARDAAPGFPGGMLSEGARSPESRAIGWTPGMTPSMEPDGMAWRLEPGTDLVVQVHMLPGERTETVDLSVGLHFTATPPTRTPIDFKLGSKAIDIPAGTATYVVEDAFVVPVDVDVLSVYPHAHYLAKEMIAVAVRPDGRSESLVRIPEWDFHWQDEYRYQTPVSLPKGTRVAMRFTYDNSAANVRNPQRPPRHVVYGAQSSDEMGDLWLRLVPRTAGEAAVLARAYLQHELAKEVALGEQMVRQRPTDPRWRNTLGVTYVKSGRIPDAVAQLEEAVRLEAGSAEAHHNLGHVLDLQGRLADATMHFREAARLAPDNDVIHLALANVLQEAGDLDGAIVHLRRAVALNPLAADAHNNLGVALGSLGMFDEAIVHFRNALDLRPDFDDARDNLATIKELQSGAAPPR